MLQHVWIPTTLQSVSFAIILLFHLLLFSHGPIFALAGPHSRSVVDIGAIVLFREKQIFCLLAVLWCAILEVQWQSQSYLRTFCWHRWRKRGGSGGPNLLVYFYNIASVLKVNTPTIEISCFFRFLLRKANKISVNLKLLDITKIVLYLVTGLIIIFPPMPQESHQSAITSSRKSYRSQERI